MKSVIAISTLLAIAGLAAAGPNILVCTEVNFGGLCQDLTTDAGVCHDLGSPFVNRVHSANTGSSCFLYTGLGCKGNFVAFSNNGASDLGAIGNQIKSFTCF